MKTIWPALLFGALTLLFPVWFGPTLASDLLARNEAPRAASEAAVKRAQCRSFFFIISTCRITIAIRDGERKLHYALSGPVRQEQRLSVIGSATSPQYLTTSLGREAIVNRGITFLAWMAILVALTIGGVNYHRYHRAKARGN